MNRQNRGTADTFLEGLCIYRTLVFVLFVISFVMALLSVISFTVVESGSETYVIVVLNLFALTGFMVVSGTVLFLCRDKKHGTYY